MKLNWYDLSPSRVSVLKEVGDIEMTSQSKMIFTE